MILVDTIYKLEKAKEKILNANVLGVDIETFDYKKKDFGTIRLVQVAVDDEVYVFDLLKVPLPDYLKEVFESKEKTKVFHFGFFDMSHLIKKYGCRFENTFCTLNGTKVLSCGLNVKYSLKNVAKMFLGEEIDKTEQQSDWGGELTESQIAYASKDASILLRLYRVQSEYIEKKKLRKIVNLENAIQRIDAFNFSERFFPESERVEKALKEIEENYFRGLNFKEIEKAKRIPQVLKEKREEYLFLTKLKEKGFYPQFRSRWNTNGFFYQRNYSEGIKDYFEGVKIVKFFNLELPAIHANARDFKSVELYSSEDFFNTRDFLLLKAIGLRDTDLMAEYSHLVNDFRDKIPGIIRWHKKMFSLLAERKPVRVASGKIIHTKNYLIEYKEGRDKEIRDREGFISFLVDATVSDFIKGFVALLEKSGARVLQVDSRKNCVEVLNCDNKTIENAIQKASNLFFKEKLFPHFYSIE
ncbi:hypothetical protein TTHT_0372 [Thermotomaculum hydrothermale]|uniref:3'-5' exonuclease domain-containing protein n=1 Tax=Thermotomaculum hydrothermale TaxID=981385 RepID=A0A7R6PMT8_9BACT|nr:hypothetical protein [Thermotomaculum hydrothermale]BBB31986.1 hypothetical protein TTHT_0372 [Thermotomaculum hydrothermale]